MAYRMILENRIKRMMDKVIIDNNGCWVWQGAKTLGGYGVSRLNGVGTVAHRISYLLLKGPIQKNMDLDHLCRNRACINPDHLEQVTRSINLSRGFEARGCINGHEFNEDDFSIVHRKRGIERRCKICHRERNKKSRDRKCKN